MAKVTYLDELNKAWRSEYNSRRKRCHSSYKYGDKDRWVEVCNAHNRRVMRQARRSVGKSNKLGCRRTARGMCAFLNEIQMWSTICRNNRKVTSAKENNHG
jgi:ribosomal protein S20